LIVFDDFAVLLHEDDEGLGIYEIREREMDEKAVKLLAYFIINHPIIPLHNGE